jgi:sugar phosphate isomerase/epimerase
VADVERALHIARRIPTKFLVVHLGLPRPHVLPGENSREAARRSVDDLQRAALPLGVQLALEVIPNELSRTGSLVHFVEEDLGPVEEGRGAGICLDFGHAHLDGDLVDAIETVSGHLLTAHVHDNRGRSDDHLVPFEGTIDWAGSLTALQKIGYDGALILEIPPQGGSKNALLKAQKARRRMEQLMADG